MRYGINSIINSCHNNSQVAPHNRNDQVSSGLHFPGLLAHPGSFMDMTIGAGAALVIAVTGVEEGKVEFVVNLRDTGHSTKPLPPTAMAKSDVHVRGK